MNEGAPKGGNGVSTKETSDVEVGAEVNDVKCSMGTDFHQIHTEDAIKNGVLGEGDFERLVFGSKVLACAACRA